MPAEETPRQKKQASKPESWFSMGEKSRKSLWTSSRSFGCCCPVGLRTTATTISTSGSSRHSRRTPWPTMPVAPKRRTRMYSLERDRILPIRWYELALHRPTVVAYLVLVSRAFGGTRGTDAAVEKRPAGGLVVRLQIQCGVVSGVRGRPKDVPVWGHSGAV